VFGCFFPARANSLFLNCFLDFIIGIIMSCNESKDTLLKEVHLEVLKW